MPEQEKSAERKAMLSSLYMRPWTLLKDIATVDVPELHHLGILPGHLTL